MSNLIDTSSLADALFARQSVRLLDVRWRLDAPEGRPAYLERHIPTAVYVDLEHELSRPGNPQDGRYPLPDVGELETSARRWGINDGELVVAYDDNDGVAAARAWWLLRRRGVDIRVLDGGIRSWIGAGLPLQTGDFVPRPGNVRLADVDPGTVTLSETARAPHLGHLVDARAPHHYRGRVQGQDPYAGHIPGAVNIPTVAHIGPDGTLRHPELIRQTLRSAGIDDDRPVVLYCGAGIASALSALAFAEAGIDTRVFPGSWSQWSRTPGVPVAVGAAPGDVFSREL